jgi:hypothetical protein
MTAPAVEEDADFPLTLDLRRPAPEGTPGYFAAGGF